MSGPKTKKRRVGRPAKKPGDRIVYSITVRFNRADYTTMCKRASKAGLSLSQYVVKELGLEASVL